MIERIKQKVILQLHCTYRILKKIYCPEFLILGSVIPEYEIRLNIFKNMNLSKYLKMKLIKDKNKKEIKDLKKILCLVSCFREEIYNKWK